MKKVILGLAALLSLAATSYAQVSLKFGANLATIGEKNEDVSKDDLENASIFGAVVGLAFELNPGNVLVLQPEILFSQSGGRNTYTLLGTTTDIRYKINYLEVPVLAKLQIGNNGGEGIGVHIAAGPWLGYALSGKTKSVSTIGSGPEIVNERDYTFDNEDGARRINYGLIGAVGLGVGKATFDLRYNYGLNNLLDEDADNTNDNRPVLQTRGVALTLGFRF